MIECSEPAEWRSWRQRPRGLIMPSIATRKEKATDAKNTTCIREPPANGLLLLPSTVEPVAAEMVTHESSSCTVKSTCEPSESLVVSYVSEGARA
eukprot:scaffold9600_cov65-Phaeocystis_antarctica.AAC.7